MVATNTVRVRYGVYAPTSWMQNNSSSNTHTLVAPYMPEKGVGINPATLEVKTMHPCLFSATNLEAKWWEMLTLAVALPKFEKSLKIRTMDERVHPSKRSKVSNTFRGIVPSNKLIARYFYKKYVHSMLAKSFPRGACSKNPVTMNPALLKMIGTSMSLVASLICLR